MGKPYPLELEILARSYDWALKIAIEPLTAAIADISHLPLICIGSGGAYTTASFVSQLHEKSFLQPSKSITPLVFRDTNLYRDKAVFIFSAGGRNPDVLGALKSAIAQEPTKIIVLCFRKNSPLSKLAKKYRDIHLIEFDLPWGGDGFLATNSLLAFNVLLLRAYQELSPINAKLPKSLETLVGGTQRNFASKIASFRKRSEPLWSKQHLVVLYGPSANSTGIDIESKFTEAALGVTQISDYRNFAHGRHFWLAKHSDTTAVLALVTNDDTAIADRTLSLIPRDIPLLRIETLFSGALADLALLIQGFYLAGFAGEARFIDPGRPGVPRFGSRIYRLNAFGKLQRTTKTKTEQSEENAICRKTQSTINLLNADKSLHLWRASYRKFVERIQRPYFQAVVFDYDGTLCDGRDRFDGIGSEIARYLEEMLKAGILLGIATGRGKSVRKDFQKKLPKSLWSKIFVGYYNGSVIGACDNDALPDSSDSVSSVFTGIAKTLKEDVMLRKLCDITLRRTQITIEPKTKLKTEFIWNLLQQYIETSKTDALTLVRSSHSFDIISNDFSKRTLVDFIQSQYPSSNILCIGDKGNFPGNDYSLLSQSFSLSVDEVSFDPDTCWNLAPRGCRGVQATLSYFESFSYTRKGVKFRLK